MRFLAVVLVLCVAGFAMCGAESMHRLSKPGSAWNTPHNLLGLILSIYLGAFTMVFAVQLWMQ